MILAFNNEIKDSHLQNQLQLQGLTSHCYAGFAIELPLLLHRPQFSKHYHVWIGHIQGSSLLNTCNYDGPHNLVIGLIVK